MLRARTRPGRPGNTPHSSLLALALGATCVAATASLIAPLDARAEANLLGQTGLVHMPDGRIDPDGTMRLGLSHDQPYTAFWGSITFLSRLELSARYTQIDGVPGFEDNPDYGDFKDKAFDTKLLLLRESTWLPSLTVGAQDYLGTRLFAAEFVAASKRIGDFDFAAGFGTKRIDGVFGGIRYTPGWHRNLSLLAEYDANDYASDYRASESGADQRRGGATYGLEYRWGWIGTQLSYQRDDWSGNLYVSVPLERRAFVPKINEPPPLSPDPDPAARDDFVARLARLGNALERQGFKNVRLHLDGRTLEISLTHTRITVVGRAVGRAARTALALGPVDMRALRVTYTVNDLPALTYTFSDTTLLRRYFAGEVDEDALAESVKLYSPSPEYVERFRRGTQLQLPRDEEPPAMRALFGEEGHAVSFRREDETLTKLHLIPINFRFFFNDPSGAFRYDTFALVNYDKQLAQGLLLNTSVRITLFEDVSEVTQPSNSELPHVRSDIAEYMRERPLVSVNKLLLNKYQHLGSGVFGRASLGYYEEMYAGTGGQVLYLPVRGDWAADLSVDWVRQREPGSQFGFRNNSVVTVLGAFHYRFPSIGLTTTVRAGQFLAGDEGYRLEIKRRFNSGVEAGAWYTITNGNDTQPPGSPDDPYHDKGLFVSIPLGSMLPRDTQQRSTISIVDFTRDVGQMVESPGDLYRQMENALLFDRYDYAPLTDFAR